MEFEHYSMALGECLPVGRAGAVWRPGHRWSPGGRGHRLNGPSHWRRYLQTQSHHVIQKSSIYSIRIDISGTYRATASLMKRALPAGQGVGRVLWMGQ